MESKKSETLDDARRSDARGRALAHLPDGDTVKQHLSQVESLASDVVWLLGEVDRLEREVYFLTIEPATDVLRWVRSSLAASSPASIAVDRHRIIDKITLTLAEMGQ